MANIREIQDRMRSIRDTMKITNAMYMISSTKLRKARKNLEETEPYFFTMQAMLSRILRHLPEIENKYFDLRKKLPVQDRVTGYIVVTADKGLAGAYNHNVLKLALDKMEAGGKWKLFVVGEMGRQYFTGKGIHINEHFHYTAQNPTLHRARVISGTIMDQFLSGKVDEVELIFTTMKNSIQTEPQVIRLLPLVAEDYISHEMETMGIYQEELTMQPSPEAVMNSVVPDCITGTIYGALVESFCSEQNARMMAMESANKSGSSMLHELSIEYNRVRQALITQEITEVIAGAKAQKKKKQQKQKAAVK